MIAARVSAWVARLSRKATCCAQGSPTSTFSAAPCAASSSHSGGTVNTRTVLIPASPISAKSVSTTRHRERGAMAADRERAVGDALDEVLTPAGDKEFAADPDRRRRCDRQRRKRFGQRGNPVGLYQGHRPGSGRGAARGRPRPRQRSHNEYSPDSFPPRAAAIAASVGQPRAQLVSTRRVGASGATCA